MPCTASGYAQGVVSRTERGAVRTHRGGSGRLGLLTCATATPLVAGEGQDASSFLCDSVERPPPGGQVINCFGLNSDGHAAVVARLEAYRASRPAGDGVVGVNLAKNTSTPCAWACGPDWNWSPAL